jgi:hypothetical protein
MELIKRGVHPMSDERKYWFPAKRYGWGWGLPSSWQGWVVLVIYFGLLGLGILLFRPHREPFYFLGYVGFLSVLLVAICRLKGEPPKWRWGKR